LSGAPDGASACKTLVDEFPSFFAELAAHNPACDRSIWPAHVASASGSCSTTCSCAFAYDMLLQLRSNVLLYKPPDIATDESAVAEHPPGMCKGVGSHQNCHRSEKDDLLTHLRLL
jgi:hypothetical protein